MKKVFIGVFLIILIFTGCSGKKNQETASSEIQVQENMVQVQLPAEVPENVQESIDEPAAAAKPIVIEDINLSISSYRIFMCLAECEVLRECDPSSEVASVLRMYDVAEVLYSEEEFDSDGKAYIKIRTPETSGYVLKSDGVVLKGRYDIFSIDDFADIFPDDWDVWNSGSYITGDGESSAVIVRKDFIITPDIDPESSIYFSIYAKPKEDSLSEELVDRYNLEVAPGRSYFGKGDSYGLLTSDESDCLPSDIDGNVKYYAGSWGTEYQYDIFAVLYENVNMEDFTALQPVFMNCWEGGYCEEVDLITNQYIRDAKINSVPESKYFQILKEIFERIVFLRVE